MFTSYKNARIRVVFNLSRHTTVRYTPSPFSMRILWMTAVMTMPESPCTQREKGDDFSLGDQPIARKSPSSGIRWAVMSASVHTMLSKHVGHSPHLLRVFHCHCLTKRRLSKKKPTLKQSHRRADSHRSPLLRRHGVHDCDSGCCGFGRFPLKLCEALAVTAVHVTLQREKVGPSSL